MKTKTCSDLNCVDPIKPISEFHKDKKGKNGLSYHCKDCVKKRAIEFYLNNKKQILRKLRTNYKNNPQKYLLKTKNYNLNNIEKCILNSIKKRCENANYEKYHRYGGRGIKNCLTIKDIQFLMKRDNYYKLKDPTIDREDNDGNYILSNCRFIEREINSGKDKKKIILQFDLDGNFVREWESLIEVERKLNINHANISTVALRKRNHAGGFVWRYKSVY